MPTVPRNQQLLAAVPGGPFPDFISSFQPHPRTRGLRQQGPMAPLPVFLLISVPAELVVTDRGIAGEDISSCAGEHRRGEG
jgi:hypothetical protein